MNTPHIHLPDISAAFMADIQAAIDHGYTPSYDQLQTNALYTMLSSFFFDGVLAKAILKNQDSIKDLAAQMGGLLNKMYRIASQGVNETLLVDAPGWTSSVTLHAPDLRTAQEHAVQRLVRQVECLTEAVAALAYCLQRGPCWGSTGDVNNALQKAWRLVEQARSNPPNAELCRPEGGEKGDR